MDLLTSGGIKSESVWITKKKSVLHISEWQTFIIVVHYREIKEVRRGKQSKDFDSRVEEVKIFEL